MKFFEVLRLFYGTMMGTSTQYVKASKRHLFPIRQLELNENIILFSGGSCNSVFFKEEKTLVNPGSGKAASFIFETLSGREDLGGINIICTQPFANFSAGTVLYESISHLYCGSPISSDLRCEVLVQDKEINGLSISVIENAYSRRDLVIESSEDPIQITGAMFYNKIHPPFYLDQGFDLDRYKEVLRGWSQQDKKFIPGEGEIGSTADIDLYLQYLDALENPEIEFSFCRENYDWTEIIGSTSLEENFDLIRNKVETHSTF